MPEWLVSLHARVRSLLRRNQLDRDLKDEVAFHLAMREQQLRAEGHASARAESRRQFGSVGRIGEELRDTWRLAPALATWARDVKYAARTLRRTPGFTVVVVLALALGIGANTAFFSVVNATLIRPLGYAGDDRLVSLVEQFPDAKINRALFSALDYDDLVRYQQSFESAAAYRSVPIELSGAGVPERVAGAKISAGLFTVLGVGPARGRAFTTDDDRPGGHVAILSWGLWQRHFGASESVLGQSIVLDREPYVVVGVMPAAFDFPRRDAEGTADPADIFVPIAFTDRDRPERGAMQMNHVVARLKPEVSLDGLDAPIALLSRQIAANYPDAVRTAGFSPRVAAEPMRDALFGRFATPLWLMMTAVGFVLLVACANIANLLLSRAVVRRREFAVRTALGAGRGDVIRLLVAEGALLSTAGGVLGVGFAFALIRSVPALLSRVIPALAIVPIDLRVLAFTAVACLATAALFGLAPAATLDRRPIDLTLRDGSARATSSRSSILAQRGFVVATVTLASVLLVGAGLFLRSFASLMSSDVGFRPGGVLEARMTLPRTAYTNGPAIRAFHERLIDHLRTLPSVQSAAIATNPPLSAHDGRAFSTEDAPASSGTLSTTALTWVQGPYLETLGMRLDAGRFFDPVEYAELRPVVIVNQKFASAAWAGGTAVGKRVKWGPPTSPAPWMTVVGVIDDVADGAVGGEARVHAYEPYLHIPDMFLSGSTTFFGREVFVAVRTAGNPISLVPAVRHQISAIDPELAIERLEPIADDLQETTAPQRAATYLIGLFAALALLLAAVGLYGLLAFATAQRRQEIAVRMALGADRRRVIGMVIGEGAGLVAIGLALGLAASLPLMRLAASLLYRTNPRDLLTYVAVPSVLAVVALAACALPAWRASRVNPASALRAE